MKTLCKIISSFLLMIVVPVAGECRANMRSPIDPGTYSGSPITSNNLDIIREKIFIRTDRAFSTATYSIDYIIRSDSAGKQIPLLFFAEDYKDGFNVWVDGKPVSLLKIPDKVSTSDSAFKGFSNSVDTSSLPNEEYIHVDQYHDPTTGFPASSLVPLRDMKYFEIDLTKGEHTVHVEYTGKVWCDRSNWVKQYSFRYVLSPARHWRSFGTLEVVIDVQASRAMPGAITTNLGTPAHGRIDSVAVWNFRALPADVLTITYSPEINWLARGIIDIGDMGVLGVFGVMLALTEYALLKRVYKERKLKDMLWGKIASLVRIGMSAILYVGFLISYGIIDDIIGSEASRNHRLGHMIFYSLIIYPITALSYWFLSTVIIAILIWVLKKRNQPTPTADS